MDHRRGFTLVELLVATTLLTLIAAGGFAALTAGTRSATKAKRYGAMIAHGQAALQTMAVDIRAAVEHGKFHLTIEASSAALAIEMLEVAQDDLLVSRQPGVLLLKIAVVLFIRL